MIAQGFGFTRDFLRERNNRAYFRLKTIPCGVKEQARARPPGEICGLTCKPQERLLAVNRSTPLHRFFDVISNSFQSWTQIT